MQGEIIDVPHTSDSAVAEMWADAAVLLAAVLEETTLRVLADRQAAIDAAAAMYYI
jgi:hypothetical protein